MFFLELNDILASLDNKHCIILASLDLSAAFEKPVDHTILLYRLHNDFGIKGKALQWFTSFITGRTQRVCIDGNSSDPHQLICGVPQGSVLSARMYTMYTQMLANVIRKHDVHITATQTTHKCMYVVRTRKTHFSLKS